MPSSGVITAPYCPDPRTAVHAHARRHPSTLHQSEPSSRHHHAAPTSPCPRHRPSPMPLSDPATTPADALQARQSPVPQLPSRAKSMPTSSPLAHAVVRPGHHASRRPPSAPESRAPAPFTCQVHAHEPQTRCRSKAPSARQPAPSGPAHQHRQHCRPSRNLIQKKKGCAHARKH